MTLNDTRLEKAVDLFNTANWYPAHDLFEEIWHETHGPERQTLQGILQIAVAQIHLENGNRNGALILYGQGLGRLKETGVPDLGLNINDLCICVAARLSSLQSDEDPEVFCVPFLSLKH